MKPEVFKDIKGYEGDYQVSNFGRIKSFRRNKEGKIMTPFGSSNGYLNINLNVNKVSKTYLVHRLVIETFLPKVEGKNFTNHKDGNKYNNNLENLEWCTSSENIKHAFKNKLHKGNKGTRNPNYILEEKDVKEIRNRYNSGLWKRKQLSRFYGVSLSLIDKIVTKQLWRDI